MAKGVRRMAHNKKTRLICSICGKEYWWAKRPSISKCCSGECKHIYASWKITLKRAKANPKKYKKLFNMHSFVAKKMGWVSDSKD